MEDELETNVVDLLKEYNGVYVPGTKESILHAMLKRTLADYRVQIELGLLNQRIDT